jgi:hypothetical protein
MNRHDAKIGNVRSILISEFLAVRTDSTGNLVRHDCSRLYILAGVDMLEQIGADRELDGGESDAVVVVFRMAVADAGFGDGS